MIQNILVRSFLIILAIIGFPLTLGRIVFSLIGISVHPLTLIFLRFITSDFESFSWNGRQLWNDVAVASIAQTYSNFDVPSSMDPNQFGSDFISLSATQYLAETIKDPDSISIFSLITYENWHNNFSNESDPLDLWNPQNIVFSMHHEDFSAENLFNYFSESCSLMYINLTLNDISLLMNRNVYLNLTGDIKLSAYAQTLSLFREIDGYSSKIFAFDSDTILKMDSFVHWIFGLTVMVNLFVFWLIMFSSYTQAYPVKLIRLLLQVVGLFEEPVIIRHEAAHVENEQLPIDNAQNNDLIEVDEQNLLDTLWIRAFLKLFGQSAKAVFMVSIDFLFVPFFAGVIVHIFSTGIFIQMIKNIIIDLFHEILLLNRMNILVRHWIFFTCFHWLVGIFTYSVVYYIALQLRKTVRAEIIGYFVHFYDDIVSPFRDFFELPLTTQLLKSSLQTLFVIVLLFFSVSIPCRIMKLLFLEFGVSPVLSLYVV